MITYRKDSTLVKEELKKLYTSVGWVSYTKNMSLLEDALINSLSTMTAWNKDELIGLIRVVGDGKTIIYIQDILIHPNFQHLGIGTTLMTSMLNEYANVRQKVLLTENVPSLRKFYQKFNFTSCDKGTLVSFYKEF
ncbi:GNAT family N-acetyltransferase [Vagococcus sp.]|uniref:GNAT family N-acetyltransferase n=1 Tax=Vagococcus sp. TaxID=1933889 RepID=UPI002FCAB23A